jgi:hypothetical protein
MKWKALSRFIASSPTRTVARTSAAVSVTGANVVDEDALASTFTRCVWMPRPLTSSVTSTLASAFAPWFITPAVTITRSWSENVDRSIATGVTATLAVSLSPMLTGVRMAPSGSLTPSAPRQPPRWKSVTSTTSRRGSVDSARMLPASLSTGP